MKKIFLIILFLPFIQLFAQITISESDISSALDLDLQHHWDSNVPVTLGSAGTNRIWDFMNVQVDSIQMQKYVHSSSTPFASTFPSSNFCHRTINTWTNDTSYRYYHSLPATYAYTGYVQLGQGAPAFAKYASEFLLVNFPLSYNQTWSSSTRMKLTQSGQIYDSAIANVRVKFHSDGWGKLVLNSLGIDTFDVLRLRHNDTIYVTAYLGIFPVFRDTIRTINYIYITNNFGIICEIESKDGETNPNFTTAATFRYLSDTPVAVNEIVAKPPQTELLRNYPNPCNPVTHIMYSLAEASDVTLKIFDITGKEMVSLMNSQRKHAGNHEVEFDTVLLASGVYVARLSGVTENGRQFSTMHTMIVAK